jgi:hypothetical protein
MIIIFFCHNLSPFKQGAYAVRPYTITVRKILSCHALKKQMRIRIQADSANSILIGFLSN